MEENQKAVFSSTKKIFTTFEIAMASVSLAMAFGLSYIRGFSMPQGGDVSLASLLPLIIYGYMFGVKKGMLICLIFSILQTIQGAYYLSFIQYILDYPIACIVVAFGAIFRNVKLKNGYDIGLVLGVVVGYTLKYIVHVICGIYYFTEFVGTQTPFWYSVGYNVVILIEMVLASVIAIFLAFNKVIMQIFNSKRNLVQHSATKLIIKQDVMDVNDNKEIQLPFNGDKTKE